MLDLNELEKRLDDALANETEASLTEWLLNQRAKDFINFLGDGSFDKSIDGSLNISQNFNPSKPEIYTSCINNTPDNDDFAKAA